MARNKYETVYIGELTQLIKDCTISSIRDAYHSLSKEETYALTNRIAGTFDVTDRIMAALSAEKEDEEEL